MNYAITLTNNEIGISVITIDTQSNAILFENFQSY